MSLGAKVKGVVFFFHSVGLGVHRGPAPISRAQWRTGVQPRAPAISTDLNRLATLPHSAHVCVDRVRRGEIRWERPFNIRGRRLGSTLC